MAVWTVEDTRRMMRGKSPQAAATPAAAPSKTSEAKQGEAIPSVAAPAAPSAPRREPAPRDELASLGLARGHVAALKAEGITDRASLAAALEANGDKPLHGMGRTLVRALRKQLVNGNA